MTIEPITKLLALEKMMILEPFLSGSLSCHDPRDEGDPVGSAAIGSLIKYVAQQDESSSKDFAPLQICPLTQSLSAQAINLYVGQIFQLTPDEVECFFPGKSRLLEKRIKSEQDFLKTTKDLEEYASNRLISYQSMSEEDYQDYQRQHTRIAKCVAEEEETLKNLLPKNIQLMALQLQAKLLLTGSFSYEEYFTKLAAVDKKKEQAERVYLSSPENIARRKIIDLKVWVDGPDDEETLSILTAYWEGFLSREDAMTHYQHSDHLLKSLYLNLRSCIEKITDFHVKKRENEPKGIQFNLPGKLDSDLQHAYDEFLEHFISQFSLLNASADTVTIRYFQLKIKKLAASLIHQKIRTLLEDEYSTISINYKSDAKMNRTMKTWKLGHQREELEFYHNQLKKYTNCDSEAKNNDYIQYIQKKIVKTELKIQKYASQLETMTDDDFAMKNLQEHPSAYPPVLEKHKELPSEWEILAYFKHRCGQSMLMHTGREALLNTSVLSINDADQDLVKINDPTTLLMERLHQEDELILALDRNKVVKQQNCAIL